MTDKRSEDKKEERSFFATWDDTNHFNILDTPISEKEAKEKAKDLAIELNDPDSFVLLFKVEPLKKYSVKLECEEENITQIDIVE